MDQKLIARLIAPATIVAIAGIFVLDLHLTRKAQLEMARITYGVDKKAEKPKP